MNTRTLIGIRKWLSLIGILSILSSLVVSIPAASALSAEDYVKLYPEWAQEKVAAAVEAGLRDPAVKVDPGAPINRATACFMLVKAFGEDSGVDAADLENPFKDVTDSLWYADSAKLCAAFGWFAGKTNADGSREFMGGANFTQEQKAVVLWAMSGKEEIDFDETFVDVTGADKFSSWAKGGAAWARANDLAFGTDAVTPQADSNNADFTFTAQTFNDAVAEGTFEVGYEPVEVGEEEEEEVGEEEEEEEEEVPPGEEEVPPVIPGTASVAVASDTTTGTDLLSGTAYNPVLKLTVSAGPEADVKVNSLLVTRKGNATNANIAGIGVFDANDVRHGNLGTSWNDNNQMEISFASEPVVVAKGTQSFIWLKANIATNATAAVASGAKVQLAIVAAGDFRSDATLSATFPLLSSILGLADGTNTIGGVTVDAVSVHNNGATDATAVNVNLGTNKQHLATFRFTNSNVEKVDVKSLTFYNNGSAADGDFTNITLNGPVVTATDTAGNDTYEIKDIATVAKSEGKYVKFTNLENVRLAKGASAKDYKLYVDVAGGSTRTLRLLIQNDYDVALEGKTSNSVLLPTLAATNDTAWPVGDRVGAGNFMNMITVAAGSLTFSRATTSPTGNVAAGATGQVLGRWEVKAAGEDMEIRQFGYAVGTTTFAAATPLSGTLYFKLRDKDDANNVYTTLYSIAGSSADYTNNSTTYTTTFVKLTAGKTYYLEAIGDIPSTATANGTYTVQAVDLTSVKRMSTNDIVDPGVAVVASNALTVQVGTLAVTTDLASAAVQVVAGQSIATTLGTWNFTAGSAEGVTITNITVGSTTGTITGGLGANFKEFEIWFDGVKKSSDTSSTLGPSTTATTIAFNISPSVTVDASKTATVELKAKLLTGAATGVVTFTIDASGVSGNGVTSQSALSATPTLAINGQVVTVNTSGGLTVSRDTVTNVRSGQLVSGTTNVVFGAYKLSTTNIEDIKIKKITVRNAGTNSDGLDSISIWEKDGTAPIGNLIKPLGATNTTLGNDTKSVTFDFSASPYVIPKNSYKQLTVKANTKYQATSGNTVQLVIDSLDLEGAGSAVKIYPTFTSESFAATTTTNAFAVGDVLFGSSGQATEVLLGTSTFASPVTTAIAAAGTTTGANALVQGFCTAGCGYQFRATKMNPIYNGSAIVSDLVAAATTATYSYAVGDVVVINDNNGTSTTGFNVVTSAVAVGGTTTPAGALVANITLAANDRITRVAGGFSETTLAVAETNYNLGDILAVSDISTAANNGLYVVTNAITNGSDMTAAAVVASQVVQLQTGAALVTGDYVAKMPTLHTEAVSASATYAYSLGDVVVVDDDSTPANNGSYVVRTAVAAGATLVGDSLGIGITFTTSDRISKLYVVPQEDNLKRLYPSKLNFEWTGSAGTLRTGQSQADMATFKLGADAANANNGQTTVSVTALNFTELSTATLINLSIVDSTNGNAAIATNANSSSFSSSAAGGTMSAITLQQGQTNTYTIRGDAQTGAGSQTAQFRFNAGSHYTAGTATWSVTNNAVTSNSTWVVLAGDVPEILSPAMTGSTAGTDTTVPTTSSIVLAESALGSTTHFDTGDTIVITFSERIDPATINSSLLANAVAVTGVTTGTGNVTSTLAGSTSTYTVANITTFLYGVTVGAQTAVTATTVSLTLNAAGTGLTITPTTITGGITGVGSDAVGGAPVLAAGTVVTGTIKDVAGNTTASAASPVPTGAI